MVSFPFVDCEGTEEPVAGGAVSKSVVEPSAGWTRTSRDRPPARMEGGSALRNRRPDTVAEFDAASPGAIPRTAP